MLWRICFREKLLSKKISPHQRGSIVKRMKSEAVFDVCVRLSARSSEQQPRPVSDVHGLFPLAALPHQHWHHVLNVRVLPGRGWRRTWRRRRKRRGGRGEPGCPHWEQRTITAGCGKDERMRGAEDTSIKNNKKICLFFNSGFFCGV